jgi:glutamyl-tRNA synthetase
MLNYHYAKMYEGKMILRFDDTNPMNEKLEFQENILRDLKTMEITPDRITFTSDYFDHLKDEMERMIGLGLAYADDTPGDEMKKQRDAGIESVYRNASVEENLKRFRLMLQGKKEEDKPKEDKKKQPEEEEKKKVEGGVGKKKDKKDKKEAAPAE